MVGRPGDHFLWVGAASVQQDGANLTASMLAGSVVLRLVWSALAVHFASFSMEKASSPGNSPDRYLSFKCF